MTDPQTAALGDGVVTGISLGEVGIGLDCAGSVASFSSWVTWLPRICAMVRW